MANEIFLALHGRFINGSMMRQAYEIARSLPFRDVNDIDDAKLFLHCLVRGTWLGIAENPEFQAHVNSNVNGVIHTAQGTIPNPQRIGWARSSRLWLPLSEENFVQIVGALVERFKQHLFAEHCWHELTRRHVGKDVNKYMYALLIDSEVITEEDRTEAYQWLAKLSSNVTTGLDGIDSSDAIHDWLTKLSALPRHSQLREIGATRIGIYHDAIDTMRKGGKYEHVSFEEIEEFADAIPDESSDVSAKEMIDNEFLQLLSANQPKIEEILSRDSPEKRRSKMGKRRFKVMEMLTQTPPPTPAEIARQLESSDQTIARDIVAIQQSWDLIQEAIHS